MRVVVVGPGAVGATFGAAAEEAGHDVVLCGRRAAPAPVVERPDGGERALRAHGVPTPISDVLVPLLAALDDAPA